MARPKGTSQYPADEAVVDEMERDYDRGEGDPWPIAAKYFDRVEGPTDNAKQRRLVAKLKARLAHRSGDEPEPEPESVEASLRVAGQRFYELLSRLPPKERAMVALSWEESTRELLKLSFYSTGPRDHSLASLVLIRAAIADAEALLKQYE